MKFPEILGCSPFLGALPSAFLSGCCPCAEESPRSVTAGGREFSVDSPGSLRGAHAFFSGGRALFPALSLLCCSPPSVGQVTGCGHGFRVLAVFLRPSSLSVNGSSQPSAGPSTGALELGSQWEAFWLPQVHGLYSLPAYWWWVGHALGSSQGVSARTTEVSWGRRPFTVGKA